MCAGSPIEIERTPQFDFEKIVALDPAVCVFGGVWVCIMYIIYVVYCLDYHFHLLDIYVYDVRWQIYINVYVHIYI
jgi:hypothetical protein